MARILAACKDAGGTNGLLPVVSELRAMGRTVGFLAYRDSPAEYILRHKGERPLVFASGFGYWDTYALPDVLMTDMSTGGGVGWDLVWDMNRNKQLSFAFQDYWGGGLANEWANPEHRPSYIIVGDDIGAETVRKAWPEYDSARICVAGYPALDKYARPEGIIAEAERMKTAHAVEFVPSVFYAGFTFNGKCLMTLVEAIELAGRRVDLIVRRHPGMNQNEPEEVPIWEEAMRRYEAHPGFKIVTPAREKWSTPSLIAAADVTVSAYSTVLLEAVMLRKPNITLWNQQVREAFMSKERGFGGVISRFPPAEFGCTGEAESVEELADLLALAFAGGLNLSAAQGLYYPADGKNARCAAGFIHRQIAEWVYYERRSNR